MAVDAQWEFVAAMLPLSADFSDARGHDGQYGINVSLTRLSAIRSGQEMRCFFRPEWGHFAHLAPIACADTSTYQTIFQSNSPVTPQPGGTATRMP
jgi:hypothetical protein